MFISSYSPLYLMGLISSSFIRHNTFLSVSIYFWYLRDFNNLSISDMLTGGLAIE